MDRELQNSTLNRLECMKNGVGRLLREKMA
jgi:hypothetical protein